MAILANKNGLLIAVVPTNTPNVWKENCPKGSTFTLKPEQTHRKVFEGETALDDAMAWIGLEKCKGGAE